MVEQFLRKLGFKLSITDAELNLTDAYKKRVHFNKKFTHHYYSSGSSPTALVTSYPIEYLSSIVFCGFVDMH